VSLLSSCTWRCLPSGCVCMCVCVCVYLRARMYLHALCACCVSVHCSATLCAWCGCVLSPIFLHECVFNACGLSLLSFSLSHTHTHIYGCHTKHRAVEQTSRSDCGSALISPEADAAGAVMYEAGCVSILWCSWAVRQGGFCVLTVALSCVTGFFKHVWKYVCWSASVMRVWHYMCIHGMARLTRWLLR
jgi:hypothetical protein